MWGQVLSASCDPGIRGSPSCCWRERAWVLGQVTFCHWCGLRNWGSERPGSPRGDQMGKSWPWVTAFTGTISRGERLTARGRVPREVMATLGVPMVTAGELGDRCPGGTGASETGLRTGSLTPSGQPDGEQRSQPRRGWRTGVHVFQGQAGGPAPFPGPQDLGGWVSSQGSCLLPLPLRQRLKSARVRLLVIQFDLI